ncbi:prenyltransferase/squalene oxidase repeat-containing protein [Amycolatopsis sp. NPDC059021]|uniref:prenyltransferase/squalene oxidase repeat-containing protein n=1 Tax=Amycolatopsis sp. NPDC059021 TaxID=3346704 RepID=UPI00366E9DAB
MSRSRAGALFGCLLIAGVLSAPAVPSSAATGSPAASAAAGFLEREFARLGHSYPAPGSGGADGGLVADALLGLHAAGETGGEFAAAAAKLRQSFFNGAITVSGIVAKYLMVATRAGVDPASWGTDSLGKSIDLVRRLESTVDENGRYRDLNAGPYDPRRDKSNVFSQSLALIALHERGRTGKERKALDYLLRQQCPGGGFRAAPARDAPASACTTEETLVSVDYTAMAVWALAELKSDPAALGRAVAWLRSRQQPDGSFADLGRSNANSTGLAALALTKAGDVADAGRANGWLVSLQLPPGGPVPAMAGAVALSADAYQAMQRDPAGFWAGQQDQLRRGTAQAILALSAAPVRDPQPPPVAPPDPVTPQPNPSGTQRVTPPTTSVARSASDSDPAAVGSAGPRHSTSSAESIPAAPSAPPELPQAVPAPEPAVAVGVAAALPPREADFLAFLRGPWGIASSVLLGFALAAAGYWLFARKNGTERGTK